MIQWLLGKLRRRAMAQPAPAAPSVPAMHWAPPGYVVALGGGAMQPTGFACGRAFLKEDWWTGDGRWATCPRCRSEWSKVGIKKFLNDR